MEPRYSQLLIDIQKKANISVGSTRDLKFLKEEIETATQKVIGFNTLRRLFGFLESRTPSITTVDTLASFLGFTSFSSYQNNRQSYEQWYYQQNLQRILLLKEISPEDFELIQLGLLNDQNVVYFGYFVATLIQKNKVKLLKDIFSRIDLWQAGGTEIHKFSMIVSTALNSISENRSFRIYQELIPLDFFRNTVPLLYIDYANLIGRYDSVLNLIAGNKATISDLFFVRLMKFYAQFYSSNNAMFESTEKPAGFDEFYPVLQSRYYCALILSEGSISSELQSEILQKCKSLQVSVFLEEIVPALIIVAEPEFLETLFNSYYESLFETDRWSSTTVNALYLIGLSYINIQTENLKVARKNLELINLKRVELSYEKYIRLFFQYVLLQLTYHEGAKKENKKVYKELNQLVRETKFLKFKELASPFLL